MRNIFPTFLLTALSSLLLSCSTQGPDITDAEADERRETALFAVDKEGAGEITRFYEATTTLAQSEYEQANDEMLGMPIDALYEASGEQLWLHSNTLGKIVVLDLGTRQKRAELTGFPAGDTAALNGMAFSNYSQGWVIAYGAHNVFHIDVRNLVRVGSLPLPGNPTAITTNDQYDAGGDNVSRDNRVYVAIERADGTGELVGFHSNDPDFIVEGIVEFPRPPFFIDVNPDGQFLVALMPGAETDDPGTFAIETDPTFYVVDLRADQIVFERPFISPPLRNYVGLQPNFATLTDDSFLYLATPDGVIRLDTKAWGEYDYIFSGKSYSVIGADYWTDLLYAVPTDAPNSVERISKNGTGYSPLTLDNPVRSIRFVSTNRIVK
ncbi:MAG: YncE family protein [Candidatus Kapaibacterium sp.]